MNQVDNHGSTPLHFAGSPDAEAGAEGSAACVAFLLERGADPERRDNDGKRPAYYASYAVVREAFGEAPATAPAATREAVSLAEDLPPPR